MTQATKETSNSICTIWRILEKDEWGKVVYALPETVDCSFQNGSTQQYNDANGIKYIPKSIYWFEKPSFEINVGDLIIQGDYSVENDPVVGAEAIKNVILQDGSLFGETDDYEILT